MLYGAIRALRRLPLDVERRGLAFDFAMEASRDGRVDASVEDAFEAGIVGPAEAKEDSDYAAKLAHASAAAGENPGDAQRKWYLLLSADPSAVVPVRSLVDSFASRGSAVAAGGLCGSLLRGSRASQSLACADLMNKDPNSVPVNFDGWRRFLLVANALNPTLKPDDVKQIFEGNGWDSVQLSKTISICTNKEEASINWQSLDGAPRDMSAIYIQFGERAENPDERRCYLAFATQSCLAQISAQGGCDEARSIPTYAQMIARDRPQAIDDLLRNKVMTCDFTGKTLNAKNDAVSQPSLTDSGRRALLQMNLAFAYIYSEVLPELSGQPVRTAQFHVDQARFFWKALHPDAPTLPEQMLPSRLR
jgi:hypothetical protein